MNGAKGPTSRDIILGMRILLRLAAVIFLCAFMVFGLLGSAEVVNGQAPRTVWDGVFTAPQAERGDRKSTRLNSSH